MHFARPSGTEAVGEAAASPRCSYRNCWDLRSGGWREEVPQHALPSHIKEKPHEPDAEPKTAVTTGQQLPMSDVRDTCIILSYTWRENNCSNLTQIPPWGDYHWRLMVRWQALWFPAVQNGWHKTGMYGWQKGQGGCLNKHAHELKSHSWRGERRHEKSLRTRPRPTHNAHGVTCSIELCNCGIKGARDVQRPFWSSSLTFSHPGLLPVIKNQSFVQYCFQAPLVPRLSPLSMGRYSTAYCCQHVLPKIQPVFISLISSHCSPSVLLWPHLPLYGNPFSCLPWRPFKYL